MSEGRCEYCTRKGAERVAAGDGVTEAIYVCEICWKMLKDPKTALPLLRGNISMNLRGKLPAEVTRKMVDRFFEEVSTWRPKN